MTGSLYCPTCGHIQCTCPLDEWVESMELEAALQDERERLRECAEDEPLEEVWTDEMIRAAGYDPDELRRLDAARDAYYGDLIPRRLLP